MKLIKFIKAFPKAIKAAFVLREVLELQVAGKQKEALTLLDKHKEFFEGRLYRYHLFRGRILFVTYDDCKNAIKEFSQGIHLIKSRKFLKPNTREYLLTWTKDMISRCNLELGKNDEADHWQKECQKHHFDIDKIPKKIKSL
ncbi:MAG: hypothetical protein IIA63_10605, partial [Nitrospinae bacterium]|nr:hypothetical protein [Nitrospinota bacterium]